MSKQEKKGLVPERRFPEFRDAGEWQVTKLKRLAKRTTLRNADCCVTRVLTNSAEFGVVDQRDFFDKDIANQGNLDGYYVVEQGDYVYNPRVSTLAPVGPISKNKIGTGVMSPLYTVFRCDNSNNEFFEHYFKTAQWHTYMRFVSNSGARHDRMAITADDFMDMPLPAPKPEEQQKIADCLTSIDELITAQTQKLDALKTHKKGMMQQLFPAEGETVPRLRFPEFRDKGEWRTSIIKDIASVVTDYVANGSFQSLRENVEVFDSINFAFYVRLTDLRLGLGHKEQKYVNEASYRFLEKSALFGGELLMANIGANVGEVWQMPIMEMPATLAPNMIMAKFKSSFYTKYVYYFLNSDIGKDNISKAIGGGAHPKINKTDLKQVVVNFPNTLKEQQKISDCLASVDELITAQAQKLDALKTHKKGLMQQLFPDMNEVYA
ncbi:restriction endonuclease subunit S [Methylomicrobium lacus]|uniref:restriction endonuclease subunit S n=1 Tax=Methylomicrobium lacus TaxID=136992 RepID=UPI0035A91298